MIKSEINRLRYINRSKVSSTDQKLGGAGIKRSQLPPKSKLKLSVQYSFIQTFKHSNVQLKLNLDNHQHQSTLTALNPVPVIPLT